MGSYIHTAAFILIKSLIVDTYCIEERAYLLTPTASGRIDLGV
jgi:hypothetical protein